MSYKAIKSYTWGLSFLLNRNHLHFYWSNDRATSQTLSLSLKVNDKSDKSAFTYIISYSFGQLSNNAPNMTLKECSSFNPDDRTRSSQQIHSFSSSFLPSSYTHRVWVFATISLFAKWGSSYFPRGLVLLVCGLALGRCMEEGHVVPVLEEHDIHRRRRLVQIMAPPFGNDGDRQEQSATEPRQRDELAEERRRRDQVKNIRCGISKPHIWWLVKKRNLCLTR